MSGKRIESLVETVASNIRRLRKRSRLTQTELAEAAGLSRAAIAQIEGQRYGSFSFATLEAISRALGVAETDLLLREASEQPKAVKTFQVSSWGQLLLPSQDELLLLAAVVTKLGGSSGLPPDAMAELLQLLRRLHDRAAGK